MQRFTLCSLVLLACAQQAGAAGLVRIADGDCQSLAAAVNAPVGHAPATIVLAAHGSYDCSISVGTAADFVVDGAGARFGVSAGSLGSSSVYVPAASSLSLRKLNIAPSPAAGMTAAKAKGAPLQADFRFIFGPPIANYGTLTLDAVSMTRTSYPASGPSDVGPSAIIANSGSLVLRNAALSGNTGVLIDNTGGDVEIVHSTIAHNTPLSGANSPVVVNHAGATRIANSIVAQNGTGANCGGTAFVSGGGNVVTDKTCGFDGASDRAVADAGLGVLGTHGGIVDTLALNYDSPAIGSGVAANCEAADIRGIARGQQRCDSGAYEFGGGEGKLDVAGVTGLYFNHASNGHYVTVQRVFDDNALVIWNTFNALGKPAWVFGVGAIDGGKIHVAQVVQNVGGTLHPDGSVSGITPTLWGTFDLDVSSCYAATLSYHSLLPEFGSGSIELDRLAFVNGLDCSQ